MESFDYDDGPTLIISWPVVQYTLSKQLLFQIMFMNGKDLYIIDPLQNKISLHFNIQEISKISYDTNEECGWKLFRIVYSNEVYVFLSKDRNEIINSITSCQRRIIAQELLNSDLQYYRDSGIRPPEGWTSNSKYQYQKYSPKWGSGYYEYQVFGVDSKNQLHPHELGLFSHFIRHFDSKSLKVFSQHTYKDVEDIECKGDKITIKYSNDHPYTFIVSHNDKYEIISIMKGRMYIYNFIENIPNIEKEEKFENREEKESGFPGIFTVSNIKEYDEMDEEEMDTNASFGDKVDNDTFKDSIREHIEFVTRGCNMYKHYKNFMGKNCIHVRYFRMNPEFGILHYGKNAESQNQRCKITGIATGSDAAQPVKDPKMKELLQYSIAFLAENINDNVYVIAPNQDIFVHWVNATRFILKKMKT